MVLAKNGMTKDASQWAAAGNYLKTLPRLMGSWFKAAPREYLHGWKGPAPAGSFGGGLAGSAGLPAPAPRSIGLWAANEERAIAQAATQAAKQQLPEFARKGIDYVKAAPKFIGETTGILGGASYRDLYRNGGLQALARPLGKDIGSGLLYNFAHLPLGRVGYGLGLKDFVTGKSPEAAGAAQALTGVHNQLDAYSQQLGQMGAMDRAGLAFKLLTDKEFAPGILSGVQGQIRDQLKEVSPSAFATMMKQLDEQKARLQQLDAQKTRMQERRYAS